jgi:kynureninase
VNLPESRFEAATLDRSDELSAFRDQFHIPAGVTYLDGNSLGPLPRAVPDRINQVVSEEWGHDLIRSWNQHQWIDLPSQVGAAIGKLVGAAAAEVIVTDSVSVNLFKLLAAALRMRPQRRVIVSERENFPTDLYMAQGLVDLLGDRAELRLVERDRLHAALDDNVAVVMLTHVDFRTGEMHDIDELTALTHECGAISLWDLAHSTGAVPVDLNRSQVDMAVGCGYKYLNGGPGAPAFAFVASRLHDRLHSPLPGWMGHAAPFELTVDYRPAPGVARLACGTPPILSLAALDCSIEIINAAGIERLRAKSIAMSELLIGLVERDCAGHGLRLASPRDHRRRGSQVSFHHEHGYPIMQALIAGGVIGDYRKPDLLRFGLAPIFLRYVDVWDAVARLRSIMESESWKRPEHNVQHKVT